MAIDSLGFAAQYSFTLEALRQTVQQEQLTASAISQAAQGPNPSARAEPGPDPASPRADGSRGTILDILA